MTMTRGKATKTLMLARKVIANDWKQPIGTCEALDMAIEALQFVEHFDLLKEYQSLQEVVRCKDCMHKEHCHETIAHTRVHDGFKEHWSEPIEWCSRGERKGGDDTIKESE